MKKLHFLALAAALVLFGCNANTKKEQDDNKKDLTEVENKNETSLNWNGTYKGFLPCASCPGILVTITLNADNTFESSNFYFGEKGFNSIEKGNLTASEDNAKLTLISEKGDTTYFAVEKDKLVMLNKEGEKAASELAEMYELAKLSDDEVEFSDKPMKGMIVFGHEVSSFAPCGSSKVFWINDLADGKLNKLYNEKVGENPTPYTPVAAELVLKKVEDAKDGFAAEYDGVVELIEIKSVELINPEACCKKK